MAAFKLVDVIETHNILGESALWHPETHCLWWTDIHGKMLFRYDLTGEKLDSFFLPRKLCSFAFTADPACLIAAFEDGVAHFSPDTGATEWLFRPQLDPGVRFNDGHTDRQGRFWVGTMVEGPWPPPRLARLYCLSANGNIHEHPDPIGITNAICTSPDGKTFYFADSARQQIFACDMNPETGALSHQRPFARTQGIVQPDGAVMDSEGCLWNVEWDGGRITRYSPDGQKRAQLNLPVSRPTSLAFGGTRNDLLFVTTAQDGLSPDTLMRQPMAGNVLVFKTDIIGISDAAFI